MLTARICGSIVVALNPMLTETENMLYADNKTADIFSSCRSPISQKKFNFMEFFENLNLFILIVKWCNALLLSCLSLVDLPSNIKK